MPQKKETTYKTQTNMESP